MERTMRPLSRQLRHHVGCLRTLTTAQQSASRAAPPPDLEQRSSFARSPKYANPANFDPLGPSKRRKQQLPPSRYQYRPPKYNRGPLHPHQSPPASDPASREFIPGPFSTPRLQETYHSTIAADLMTLSYAHYPPGTEAPKKGERLRKWVGDSPYFKNRPLRGPRGDSVLRYIKKPLTFRNVPQLDSVIVHTQVNSNSGSANLHVAGMVLQAITGAQAVPHQARHNSNDWDIKKGQWVSLTCTLRGEEMYHFLAKTIDVLLPKVKDWPGIAGSSGDSSGNISMGLKPEHVALFPEIEVNYDAYPTKMIPGCHIHILTTARNDRDARMLLNACGLPFHGRLIN